MRVFITGGCGQIGSHIAERLLARGDEVLVIDNFATGRRMHLADQERLRVVEGSIADREVVNALFMDFRPEVVVHTAASYKDPDDWYNDTLTNAVGGCPVIRAAMDHKAARFI